MSKAFHFQSIKSFSTKGEVRCQMSKKIAAACNNNGFQCMLVKMFKHKLHTLIQY
jgi:hypothetical protein